MVFIWIALIGAYLGSILGLAKLGMAIYVATNTPTAAENAAAARRYLASATTGEAINEVLYWLVICVVIGVLAETGKAVVRAARDHRDALYYDEDVTDDDDV